MNATNTEIKVGGTATKTASIWLHGRAARLLVRDENGNVIAQTDAWNNIASAQMAVLNDWDMVQLETVERENQDRIRSLNEEWNASL